VTEGEIVQWLVRVGEEVSEDDPMVEVMTDKATVTIGAPCDGRVVELRFDVGAVARVGQVIVSIESTSREPLPVREAATERPSESSDAAPAATAVGRIAEQLPGVELLHAASDDSKPLATPAVRRLAKELALDLRRIRPTGPHGRITAEDVEAAARARDVGAAAAGELEERVPIRGVRRRIAERMEQATRTAAHFTFVEECDASALVEIVSRLAPRAARRGIRLTFLPFVIKAVAKALPEHPALNAAVDDETSELIFKRHYDIGVATATDAGLMVPVIRGADALGVFEIAERVQQLADAARAGTSKPEDLRGSTFTVTSLGRRSGLFATPILNYPEVGILGVHRIKARPVVRDGEIVVGQVMLLSLSFDHRIVDGHVGAAFAYDVIARLEDPEALVAESAR
jgi:pyruvate dehydrogenase E2 component (dihydrolipoamide acetyltransferase)